jgi:hypothetical protein
VADREGGEGQQVLGGVTQHRLELGELAAQHPRDHLKLLVDVGGVGLGEDGADGGGDHLGRALGTWASTFLRKWTRQRCTAAPAITALTAWRRPR